MKIEFNFGSRVELILPNLRLRLMSCASSAKLFLMTCVASLPFLMNGSVTLTVSTNLLEGFGAGAFGACARVKLETAVAATMR